MEDPTLTVERGASGFGEDWEPWGFCRQALLLLKKARLAALVFECLEAVLTLICKHGRAGRMYIPRQLLKDLGGRHIAKRTLQTDL